MPAYQPKTAKAPAQTPAATRAGPLLTSGLSRNPQLAALAQFQAQLASSPTVQRLQALQRAAGGGSAGLPGNLQAGIEHLSGLSLDGVRVHRNSDAPAKVGALAYAQGRDIHLGPGQERHLPHEAWHVVQQAQGRV